MLLSMTNGIQSLMGEMLAKEEFDKLRKFFGWVEWSIHTGTIFIFAVTSVLIVPFVEVYILGINDANYTQPMFALLIVAANAGHCLRLPYNLMILAGGHYKQTQSNYVVASILNIVFSILLVKFWGLVGIAIGTLIAMLYQTIWMAIYDYKNFIKWPIRNFVKQFLIDFITAIMIILIGKIISINDITWSGWIFYAIKVSLIAVVFILLINYIFYRTYIIKMFDKIKR